MEFRVVARGQPGGGLDTAAFANLMPGFVLIGVGSGLTVPLTESILRVMPADRAGIASAVLNASREVSGLLGITVTGAVLRSREAAALRQGATPLGGSRIQIPTIMVAGAAPRAR